MSPYAHTTLGTMKTELAARLHDTSNVFWVADELGGYIHEAMRVWNVLTGFWRTSGIFNTSSGDAFYNLNTSLSATLGFTMKDQDLVGAIQYHLLEPKSVTSWTGTEMFTLAEVTAAIQRRRDQFLDETGCVLTERDIVFGSPPAAGQFTLPDTVINIRRLVWNDVVTATHTNCIKSDEHDQTASGFAWGTSTGIPYAYSVTTTPALTVQLFPIPANNGTAKMLTVETGATLNPSVGVLLGIPDDYAWIVKWGAMADLLGKDGMSRDAPRAQYCEDRYRWGVTLVNNSATILNAEIAGRALIPSSLWEFDAGYFSWQSRKTGTPTDIAVAGRNIIALRPVPNGSHSIGIDHIRNTPVPANDAAQIDLGREQLDVILDYAEHLAAFKMSGPELAATLRAAENMITLAGRYNSRLASIKGVHMHNISRVEDQERPARVTGVSPGAWEGEK